MQPRLQARRAPKHITAKNPRPQKNSRLQKLPNYAFIDSQNLHLSIRKLGWKLDFARFRVYLKEKFGVGKAYLFIGYIEENTQLYASLQEAGFICIFKPTLEYKDGTTKGNCDAELVLQAMIEYENYEQAVLVTGDGDFYCLAKHLLGKKKLKAIVIPNKFQFSALFKFQEIKPYLRFMNELKNKLAKKTEEPTKDDLRRAAEPKRLTKVTLRREWPEKRPRKDKTL